MSMRNMVKNAKLLQGFADENFSLRGSCLNGLFGCIDVSYQHGNGRPSDFRHTEIECGKLRLVIPSIADIECGNQSAVLTGNFAVFNQLLIQVVCNVGNDQGFSRLHFQPLSAQIRIKFFIGIKIDIPDDPEMFRRNAVVLHVLHKFMPDQERKRAGHAVFCIGKNEILIPQSSCQIQGTAQGFLHRRIYAGDSFYLCFPVDENHGFADFRIKVFNEIIRQTPVQQKAVHLVGCFQKTAADFLVITAVIQKTVQIVRNR